jgi:hypothetical protein
MVGPSTPWDKLTKIEQKARRWEQANVFGTGYFAKKISSARSFDSFMRSKGYDAYRISPSVTHKFGKAYRAVYGGYIDEQITKRDASGYPVAGHIFPKVKWDLHVFIKNRKGIRSGTRTITPLSQYTGKQRADYKSQLMLRKRSPAKRRR